jgi:hypothetical protein
MVSEVFSQPGAALWVYVFVVLIILVIMLIGSSLMPYKMDKTGNLKMKAGLGFLIVAIILGIIVYFLEASNVEQWAWFIALMPVALVLFGVYFTFFFAMGSVMLLIGAIIAFIVMVWVVYYAFVTPLYSILAFPLIFLILVILGGIGWGSMNKKKSRRGGKQRMMESMSQKSEASEMSDASLADILDVSNSPNLG